MTTGRRMRWGWVDGRSPHPEKNECDPVSNINWIVNVGKLSGIGTAACRGGTIKKRYSGGREQRHLSVVSCRNIKEEGEQVFRPFSQSRRKKKRPKLSLRSSGWAQLNAVAHRLSEQSQKW